MSMRPPSLDQTSRTQGRGPKAGRMLVALCMGVAALLLAACGDSDVSDLTGEAAEGQKVARDLGCVQCHSDTEGVNVRGPSWAGLAGSEVTLEDGTTVTADRAYLERAITEPAAEIVEGFKPIMPRVPLNDTQLDQVIAYIEALGDGPPAG